MADEFPSVSTDQVAAFVELARQGSLRRAAEVLHLSEQGVRVRLLTLEQRLGVELYRKRQGPHKSTQLTQQGLHFLPNAANFLLHARNLLESSGPAPARREIHVVASQYLSLYLVIDAIKRFHALFPDIHVRLSTRTERDIEDTLLRDPNVALGVAAPYEASPELEYQHIFSMNWSLITPARHSLSRRRSLKLEQLETEPLILFERGSTGRQHIIDAFRQRGITPRIDMEMTNTELIVRSVEAGLGISIVPLLPSGAVTRGRRLGICALGRQIGPIDSGVLTRRGESLSDAAAQFINFLMKNNSRIG